MAWNVVSVASVLQYVVVQPAILADALASVLEQSTVEGDCSNSMIPVWYCGGRTKIPLVEEAL